MADVTLPYTFTSGTTISASQMNASLQALRDGVNDIDVANMSSTLVKYFPTTVVSSLPGSPIDGQVAQYQSASMATDGIVWRFRYNSSSASSYKWEFIGGAAWVKEVATQESTSSTSFAALSTAGPSVTAPLAGDYIIRHGTWINPSSTETGQMSFDIGGTGASGNDNVAVYGPGGGISVARENQATLAASDAIVAKYKSVGGSSVTFAARWLSLIPVRVS